MAGCFEWIGDPFIHTFGDVRVGGSRFRAEKFVGGVYGGKVIIIRADVPGTKTKLPPDPLLHILATKKQDPTKLPPDPLLHNLATKKQDLVQSLAALVLHFLNFILNFRDIIGSCFTKLPPDPLLHILATKKQDPVQSLAALVLHFLNFILNFRDIIVTKFMMIKSLGIEARKSEDAFMLFQETQESVRVSFLNCLLDFAGMERVAFENVITLTDYAMPPINIFKTKPLTENMWSIQHYADT
ncbi:hypothetical protein LXL04_029454 [Taraxacum kok-saghyz]